MQTPKAANLGWQWGLKGSRGDTAVITQSHSGYSQAWHRSQEGMGLLDPVGIVEMGQQSKERQEPLGVMSSV